MSQTNGQPLDPVELVSLPADDPRRCEFAEKMRAGEMTAIERAEWDLEFAVTDRLRTVLPEVEMPEGLEARLLEIAEKDAADEGRGDSGRKGWQGMLRLRMGLRHVAAVLVVAGIVGYLLWPRMPVGVVTLKEGLRNTIATWAVRHHEVTKAGEPLEIVSSNADAVQRTLAAHGFDFPVMLLKPSEGVALRGGGACNLGSAKAAYTQWQAAGVTYTLYEFNGKDLGAPPEFLPTMEMPTELWKGDLQYRVVMWPGSKGKCCWALVMENENASNVFAQFGYGT